ncbi:hypothetical protein [Photobacterium ganghwense]|uniref:hypothetical protein n=1 Tax=Photobacterium ganghwense TaxID=320778 RepID=UPI000A8940C1|nr:hypothetical protein [Photobacterium ganghwense]
MKQYLCKTYTANSGRGDGEQKVISCLLTSPDDVLEPVNNHVLESLRSEGLSRSIGVYFYRFKNEAYPFIKIGECTRKDGIEVRFKRGWHGTYSYSDSYLGKKVNGDIVDSDFLSQIKKISPENPAYFVFYEHLTSQSHPKIDEVYAYRMHKRLFKCGTLSPERMNGNPLLARKLLWHKPSFSEVCRCEFPDGSTYV